jgi:hypothetical protein
MKGSSQSEVLAERVGFEPTVEFPLHTLSKRAPSTTRTSLRLESIAYERCTEIIAHVRELRTFCSIMFGFSGLQPSHGTRSPKCVRPSNLLKSYTGAGSTAGPLVAICRMCSGRRVVLTGSARSRRSELWRLRPSSSACSISRSSVTDHHSAPASRTAAANACGASCGRLCPIPPVSSR